MTTTDETPLGSALARVNPEDDPNVTDASLVAVGAPPRPGTALVAARSSGMQHLDELMRYATIFASAGIFKGLTAGDLKRQAAMCAVKVIAGDELGLPPMASMRSIHVFDGKVELSGALILSLINRYQVKPAPSGMNYRTRIVKRTDEECVIAFASREPGEPWEVLEEVRFTIKDAQRAGLTSKDNWKTYPRAMLFNRCASEGARVHAAECFNGPVYGAGEISGANIDADGNFLESAFDRATGNAAAAMMQFDQEIVDLAKRAGWSQQMLEAQAARLGDRGRLLETLKKHVERTENSSRGINRRAPEPKPETFESAAPSEKAGSLTERTRKALFAALNRRNITEKPDRLAFALKHGVEVDSYKNLSQAQGEMLLSVLTSGEDYRDRVLLARCLACGEVEVHAKDCPIDETAE